MQILSRISLVASRGPECNKKNLALMTPESTMQAVQPAAVIITRGIQVALAEKRSSQVQVEQKTWPSYFNCGSLAVGFGTVFVAVLLVAQIYRSGWCNFESAHIPSGLYHLETGRMDAYRVNPPLPRMMAALPLLVDCPSMHWFSLTAPNQRNEYVFAENWIRDNLAQVPRQLRFARSVMLLFFLLGAWTIFTWSTELYGRGAGWLALTLWSLSPDVITYSATVGPDLPAAATGLFACYWFSKWLHGGRNEIPWKFCFGLALATLSKFSWLFLFVLLPCVTLIHDLLGRSEWSESKERIFGAIALRWDYACRRLGKLAFALFCTVIIINFVYGFNGTGRPLGDFEFLSTPLKGDCVSRFEYGNRFRGTLLGSVPIPIPSDMLQGIDFLKWEFDRGMPCYLQGEWKLRGWWYYYFVAMAVKFPIGYFVLIGIGSLSMVASYLHHHQSIRGEWLLPLVAGLFLAQVSSQTGFTHHLRYVLPAFGFLYMMAARTMIALPRWLATVTIITSLLGTVVYHATHVGQAHAHFNCLAGGPENGWRYLSLSNVDSGQSTYRMAYWARIHPEKRPLTVVFVSELGGPSQLVADLYVTTSVQWRIRDSEGGTRIPTAGWYLLSSEQLTHKENSYFREARPDSWPFADAALFYVSKDAELD